MFFLKVKSYEVMDCVRAGVCAHAHVMCVCVHVMFAFVYRCTIITTTDSSLQVARNLEQRFSNLVLGPIVCVEFFCCQCLGQLVNLFFSIFFLKLQWKLCRLGYCFSLNSSFSASGLVSVTRKPQQLGLH